MLKKGLLLVASLLVMSTMMASGAVNSVGDPGRSWAQPDDADLGLHVQQFIDTVPQEEPSYLVQPSFGESAADDPTCTSLSDERCVGKNLQYSAVLPRCESAADIDCTSDFGTVSATGVKTSALFSRYFPTRAQNQFQGDPLRGLPSGVAGSLYTLPSAPHDGGDQYYLATSLKGSVSASGQVSQPGLQIRISPVGLESSGYFSRVAGPDAGWAYVQDQNPGVTRWGIQGPGYSGNQYCVANSASERLCAQKYSFPAETRFYISARLGKLPAGWMHGRMSDPNIQITPGSGFSTIDIEGNPMAVPTVYKKYRYTEMPAALKNLYDVEKAGYKPTCPASQSYCGGGRSGPSKDPLNRNVIINPQPWDAAGMEQLKAWIPYIDDKATALPSFWSARTLSENEMSSAGNCFNDKSQITGIVTTNSTQYSAGPPRFNKSEGTLDYQVAAPHYGSNGDVFKGSYDLVMRSDVARCVYGFSKAPIRATLSITSSDGTPQVATTIIGERKGWLYLSAKNFEFSAPIVKATLIQDAPVVVIEPPATVVPKMKAKTTITCVKGKVSKKISAINPRCPTGFKKKA